jgi:GT2 family glycosyltransferase
MKVFVVIVTYNPAQWIERCFGSLRKSTIPLQVIAVDNGSADGSQEKIARDFPEVDLITSGANAGFASGNNIGMKKAFFSGADFVFLLNQDAWIDPDTVEKLVSASLKNPDFAILSPMHLNGAGTALDYRFSYFIQPQFCADLYSDIYFNKVADDIYEADFINAAAWLMTRKCLEIVGGFNPSFFLYGEDDNYVKRMKYHQLKIGVYPFARIYHDRIHRNRSVHFTDFETGFKRDFISKYSDPFENNDTNFQKKIYLRKSLKSIFSFNIGAYRNFSKESKLLKALPLDAIDQNKKLSQRKGTTFL